MVPPDYLNLKRFTERGCLGLAVPPYRHLAVASEMSCHTHGKVLSMTIDTFKVARIVAHENPTAEKQGSKFTETAQQQPGVTKHHFKQHIPHA
jgi:hypothetical protein